MAKRQLSEEQKQALRERLAKARAAKQNKHKVEPPKEPLGSEEPAPITNEQLNKLLERLDNLEHNVPVTPVQTNQAQLANGKVIGVVQEFSVKGLDYPSPVQRLLDEPDFLQFGLKQNYELKWAVKPVNYETRDGLKHVEPRFELELNLYMRDEDNQLIKNENGTYKAIAFRKGMFFEDKEAAEYAAHDMGLDFTAPDIYDRLRYASFKQWLKGIFTPPKPIDQGNHQRTEIFNNQEFNVIDSIREEAI